MMKQHQRICIYAADVCIILGKSLSQARRILATIKSAYGKTDHQYVSIKEFADYTGLDEEDIRAACRH